MTLKKEIKEKVFKIFRAWEEKNYPDASETSLSDWNIGRYKEVFTMVPSGDKRGNYMYFVKDYRCVGLSPAFADVDSIYQAFLQDEEPENS